MTDATLNRFPGEADGYTGLGSAFSVNRFSGNIQAAIDEARATEPLFTFARGGGTVYVPAGEYDLTDALDLWPGVSLICDDGAVLRNNLMADQPMLNVHPNAAVTGGQWRATKFSQTTNNPAINVVAAEQGDLSTAGGQARTRIQDLNIVGSADQDTVGVGIYPEVPTGAPSPVNTYVTGLSLRGVRFYQLGRGIHINAIENAEAEAFANGNNFADMYFNQCNYGIYLETSGAGGGAASANNFSDFSYQAVAGESESVIYVADTRCSRNVFSNFTAFDWQNLTNKDVWVLPSFGSSLAGCQIIGWRALDTVAADYSNGANNHFFPAALT